MRVPIDWRSASVDSYKDFCKKNPTIHISSDIWRNIIYTFNEDFRTYLLETGDKAKLPGGLGEFAVNKKKRVKTVINPITGKEHINLPIDWKKTKERGKLIYNFNHHTEGYFFGWLWFKKSARFQNLAYWYFKPSRVTSRLITHYINIDKKYQNMYHTWKF